MKQLDDTKNNYKQTQKQFKKQMVEMSDLIENTLQELDIEALKNNSETLSQEYDKTSKKEDELDDKIRETVSNMLTRKRTTLGEKYTIREGEFYSYGTTRTVSRTYTHKVLNRLNKDHFNGDMNRWESLKKIRDEYQEIQNKWEDVNFKETGKVDVEQPDTHVLDTTSNERERIGKIDEVKMRGGRYTTIRFRDTNRSTKEKVKLKGYKAENFKFRDVYLLASTRNQLHEIQESQLKKILEKRRDIENRIEAVKNHGKSFNVANKLSSI